LRRLQSGNTRSYATWVLFGSVLAIVVLVIATTNFWGGLQ
jgi:hypothetical protein